MAEHKMVTIDGVRYRPEHVDRAKEAPAAAGALGTDKAAGKARSSAGTKAGGSAGDG